MGKRGGWGKTVLRSVNMRSPASTIFTVETGHQKPICILSSPSSCGVASSCTCAVKYPMTMSNLDTFVRSSRPAPAIVATSQEIRDRGSIFVGSVYRATNPEEAKAALHYHKHVVHAGKDVYEISAWRCMALKPGRTGLSGPDDFELKTGFDDGGEQWAGSKILKIMQTEGVIDAIVIVSRWFVNANSGLGRFADWM